MLFASENECKRGGAIRWRVSSLGAVVRWGAFPKTGFRHFGRNDAAFLALSVEAEFEVAE